MNFTRVVRRWRILVDQFMDIDIPIGGRGKIEVPVHQ